MYQQLYNILLKYISGKGLESDVKVRVFDLLQRQVRDKQTEFLEQQVVNDVTQQQYSSAKSNPDQQIQYYLES